MNLNDAQAAFGPTTFSKCYAQFSENVDRIVKDVEKISLLMEHFELFAEMQQLYNKTKRDLGEHCTIFAGYFRVFRTALEKFSESPQQDNMAYLEKVLTLLKTKMIPKEDGHSPFVAEAIAESSLKLAHGLIELMQKLRDLQVGLQHPHYKRMNISNIWAGIAGVIGCVAGLILIATPLVSTVPWIVSYSAHIAFAGGGIAAGGALACFQGFAKVSALDETIESIRNYVKEKERDLQKLNEPVCQHSASAGEIVLESQIEVDIDASKLATYVESFEILDATFRRQEPPSLTLTERVQHFIQQRSEILTAMSGAAVATAIVTAASACCPVVGAEFHYADTASRAVSVASVV